MRRVIAGWIVFFATVVSGCSYRVPDQQEFYRKGVHYLSEGNIKSAILLLRKAIEKDPNYYEARYYLGLAFIQDGEYDSAVKELLKTLKLNPSYDQAELALAKAYAGDMKIEDAEKVISSYLQSRKGDADSYAVAASVYAARRDYTAAEKYAGQSLAFSSRNISSIVLLSEVYLKMGKVQEAEELIRKIRAVDHDDRKALSVLARIRQMQGRDEEALDIFEKIVLEDPRDVTAYVQLAMACFRTDDLGKAREVIDRLEKYNRKSPEVSYLRGIMRYHEGEIADAMVFLKEARKAGMSEASYYLGLCYLDNMWYGEAIHEFQQVINNRPSKIQPLMLISLAYLEHGAPEKAVSEARKALQIDASNAFAHNVLGSAYLALGKDELAIKEFNDAIDLDPWIIEAHFRKRPFQLLSRDAQNEENEFIGPVNIDPDVLSRRVVIAVYYMKNNKYKDALSVLQDELNGDSEIYNNMETVYSGSAEKVQDGQCFRDDGPYHPGSRPPNLSLADIGIRGPINDTAVGGYLSAVHFRKE